MNKWALGLAVALLGVLALWLWHDVEVPTEASAPSHSTTADPAVMSSRPNVGTTPAPASDTARPTLAPPVADANSILPAADTMAYAREVGDDRAPPIDAADPEESLHQPAQSDVSDPARYRDHEQRQQQRVAAQYVRAADGELPKWRAALIEARMRGASPEDIAAAEEKIRRLEDTQAALRNGEVLTPS